MLRLLRSTRSRPLPSTANISNCRRPMTTEMKTSDPNAAEASSVPDKITFHPGCHRDMRRTFYIDAVVDKIMNKSLGHPFLMWTKTRAEWYRLLNTEKGCQMLLKSRFLIQLRSSIQDDELEATKRFGSEKVCLGRSFAEHWRIKRSLYHFKYKSLAECAMNDFAAEEFVRSRDALGSNEVYSKGAGDADNDQRMEVENKDAQI